MQAPRRAQTNPAARPDRATAHALPCLLILMLAAGLPSLSAAPVPSAVSPRAKHRAGPRLGTARGVLFSEFNRDNGSLLLELNASTAEARGGAPAADDEPDAWHLGDVLLRFYEPSRAGTPIQTAVIRTADCLYVKKSRTAGSEKALEFDSSKFRVEGTGWNWENHKEYDSIRVLHDVRATLKADARSGHERVDIFSDRLEIVRFRAGPEQGRARFVFTGGVRAVMKNPGGEDVMLFADTLVARLRNTDRSEPVGWLAPAAGGPSQVSGAGARKSHEAMLDEALDNIVLSGNVRILDANNREMTGDLCSYVHATGVFATTGNARLFDPEQKFTATGGRMLLRTKEEQIEVLRQPAPAQGEVRSAPPVVHPPVRLQIPSIIEQEHEGRGHALGGNSDGFTTLEADHLVVTKKPATTIVTLKGNVVVTDVDFSMRAGSVRIDAPRVMSAAVAPRAPQAPPLASASPQFAAARGKYEVRHVVAEGDVHATHEGRGMDCGRITFHPGGDLVILEKSPLLSASGARLSGGKIEMDVRRTGNRSIRVHSSASRRASVVLPPRKQPAPANALFSTPTNITAGEINMAETDRLGKEALLRCTGGVMLDGGGLKGRCLELEVDVDVDVPLPKTRPGTLQNKAAQLAAIRKFTATGNVRMETERYAVDAGQAVLHPNVALTENSPLDDNGLDGAAPQFLLLLPHKSSPGLRPRLTHTPLPASPKGVASAPPTGKPREAPASIEGDKLEIIGGAMRSRFYMSKHVVFANGGLTVTCDNMAGTIAQEAKPSGNVPANRSTSAPAELAPRLASLSGRGSVRIREKDTEAAGDSFEYQPAEQKFYLLGNPVVRGRDGIRMDGLERIVLDRRTGNWQALPSSTIIPSAANSRPKVTIPSSALKANPRN
ncbi:MAG: hypothetical protein LBG65_05140 [Puniceicoccales bacterium]|nr:hypothetical protein [Puniceicoccales bacterium]